MRNQYSDSGDYVRNRRTKLVKITTRLASIVDIRSSDWRSRVDTSRKTKSMIEKDGDICCRPWYVYMGFGCRRGPLRVVIILYIVPEDPGG